MHIPKQSIMTSENYSKITSTAFKVKIKAVGKLNKRSYNTDRFSKKKLNSRITKTGFVQTGKEKLLCRT